MAEGRAVHGASPAGERILISVAVITYNQEKYIGEALDSVLMQEVGARIEIVVGEDCSTDSTGGIVRKYAERHPDIVQPILRDRNLGPVPNWIDVLLRCDGAYVALLEGDDYWTDPGKLQKQLSVLEGDPHVSGVYHAAKLVDETGARITSIPEDGRDFDSVRSFLSTRYRIPSLSVMFRNFYRGADHVEVRRIFDGLHWVGDFLNDLIIVEHGKYVFLDQEMGVYRNHLSSGESFSAAGLVTCIREGVKVRRHGDRYFGRRYHDLFAKSIEELVLEPFVDLWKTSRRRQAIRLFRGLETAEKIVLAKWLLGCR